MSPDAYDDRMATADLIVAHAGMGSIITALSLAKPILILPRRADAKEQRNDHQIATAQRFASRSAVYVAQGADELQIMLDRLVGTDKIVKSSAIGPYAEPQLIDTVRSFILNNGRE